MQKRNGGSGEFPAPFAIAVKLRREGTKRFFPQVLDSGVAIHKGKGPEKRN